MHWVTAPGTSHRRGDPRSSSAACVELRAIPGVRNFGSHIGQAFAGRRGRRRRLRRELDQRRSGGRLRRDAAPRSRRSSTAIRASTATSRPISRSASARCSPASSDAIVVRIFGHDLGTLQAQGRGGRGHARRHPGHRRPAHASCRSTSRRSRSRSTSRRPQRYGIKPGDVRRAAVDPHGRRGGRRHLPRRQGLRRRRSGARPRRAHSLTDIREPARSTRPAAARPARRRGRRQRSRPTPNTSATRDGSRQHRRRRQRQRPRPRRGRSRTSRQRLRATRASRSEYHAELLGEFAERQAAQDRLLLFAIVAAVGDLPAAAGRRSAARAWRCCPS